MSISDCEYHLRPSRRYVLLSVGLHSGAVLALWVSGLGPGPALALTVVILAGLIHDVRGTGLRRSRGAINSLQVQDGEFSFSRNDGSASGPARIRSGWVLGTAVLLCLVVAPWRRETVVVPADALSPEAFRRLRIAAGAALDAAEPARDG
jgi:hypothetical protein